MSDVLSIRELLDILTEKMAIEVNKTPRPPPDWEKVESFYVEMIKLFSGTSRPIRCTMELQNCVTQFFCYILSFITCHDEPDEAVKTKIIKRWMTIFNDLGSLEIQNRFAFFATILEDVFFLQNVPLWLMKDLILRLNRIFENVTYFLFTMPQLRFFFRILAKWLKLLCICGDYEFQNIIVETIISTCEKHRMAEVLQQENMSFDISDVLNMFLRTCRRRDNLKTFLSTVNSHFNTVHSIFCSKVALEETVIPPLKGPNGDGTWMHINYGFDSFSFSCHPNCLRSPNGSDCYSNTDELVSVNFKDIVSIVLLTNESKIDNSIVGIFVIQLAGQCSCRFDSSIQMVGSIKKIKLAVSNYFYIEFLKEEFFKLFGEKFKEYNSKQSKVILEEEDFILESTQNLPLKTASRRMQKQSEPTTSSQKNVLNQHSFEKENSEEEDTTNKNDLLLRDMITNTTIFPEYRDSFEGKRKPSHYRFGKAYKNITTVHETDKDLDYRFDQDYLAKRVRREKPKLNVNPGSSATIAAPNIECTIFGTQALDDEFDEIIDEITNVIDSPEIQALTK